MRPRMTPGLPRSPAPAGRCRLIVFAKAPVPGQVKTRLIPELGADGAAALAARLLRHALQQAGTADVGPVELCGAPDALHPAFDDAVAGLDIDRTAQGDGDLGERMQRALQRALATSDRALLIGTDAPALDARCLREAAAALDRHDAVFVPALDGGYVAVGLRRGPVPPIFDGMPWSTPGVMAATRARLRAAGVTHHELAPLADIDVPADLHHLEPLRWP